MTPPKGAALLAVGIAAVLLLPLGLVLLLVVVMAPPPPAATSSATGLIGGPVRAGSVPAVYAQWVQAAGSICPAISPALIAAQIQEESGWNPTAVSSAGAEGIAQFLPGTFVTYAVAVVPGPLSPMNAPDAIVAQGHDMCAAAAQAQAGLANGSLHGATVTDLALAIYNCGGGCVQSAGGIPQNGQTLNYIQAINTLVSSYAVPTAVTVAATSSISAAVVAAARSQLGVPYSWGGGNAAGPTTGSGGVVGFDCSGLALYAWAVGSNGAVTLPHSTTAQFQAGTPVALSAVQPGDLLFFNTTGPISHVGIAIGGGQMIDAPTTGGAVEIVTYEGNSYWTSAFAGARSYAP